MAKGDKITPTSANRAMAKIQEMQRKWGLGVASKTFPAGNKVEDTDARDMYAWLTQAKSKSGWSGTVPSQLNVSAGVNITDVFDLAYNTAETIRTHCACNCNYCRCNCDHCSCDCNQCCTDGSDFKSCLDHYKISDDDE